MIISKIEATSYTAETLASTDFNVRVTEPPSYSPEIAEYRRKILNGELDLSTSVMGRQMCSVTFKVDLTPAAAVDTEPQWSKLLQACGLKPTVFASNGYNWVPHTDYTHIPITIEVIEENEGGSPSQLVYRIGSAMGNVRWFIGTVGEPVQMEFTFTGALLSIADRASGSALPVNGMSTIVPPAVLSITATVGGVAQDLDTLEFNMNNDVQIWIDPSKASGIKGAYIAGREPTLTMDPTTKLLATEDWYTQWKGSTTLAVSVALGSTPALTLSAPAAQYLEVGQGDRNGARVAEKTFLLTDAEGASSNAVFKLLQGAES